LVSVHHTAFQTQPRVFTDIAKRGVLPMLEDIRIRMEKINDYILEFRRYL
jgi:hypothetical protein